MTESEIQKITTIATPYYNTPKRLFEAYLEKVTQFDCKVLIVNDGSDEEHTKNLIDLCQGDQFEIVHLENNLGIMGVTKELIKHIKTEFFVRVDADDLLKNFPWDDGLNPDEIDGLIVKKSKTELIPLLTGVGSSPHGSLYRTSVFRGFMKKDKFDITKEYFIHEDMYWHIWLIQSGVRLISLKKTGIYKRKFHVDSITSQQVNVSAKVVKLNTFYFWCVLNSTPEFYFEVMAQVLANQSFEGNNNKRVRKQKRLRGML